MPSLPRGRQASHARPLVASVFTAASANLRETRAHSVSSKLRHRRDDRSPPPTPRRTADRLDPRPTRGGSTPLRNPGRRPSRGPRRRGAATVYEQRPTHVSFRKEAHTCPGGTSRAPRARRGPRPRRRPVSGSCGCFSSEGSRRPSDTLYVVHSGTSATRSRRASGPSFCSIVFTTAEEPPRSTVARETFFILPAWTSGPTVTSFGLVTVQLSGAGPVRSTQRARAAARLSCVSVSGAARADANNVSQARRRICAIRDDPFCKMQA